MAIATLMDYLAGDALTKLAQAYAVKPGLARPLPAAFYTPGPTKTWGTAVKWDLENGSRESAKVTNPDAPSQSAQGVQTDQKKVVAIGSREHYAVGLELIQALQHPGDLVQAGAKMELQRQIKAFTDRFINIRTNAVHSAVFRGKIDIGSTGLIQTSSSGPVRTIDYSPSDTGVNLTTAGAGSTYAIGDWATTSTAIITKVKGLKKYVSKTYNFKLTDAYYGVNVPEYLAANTNFQAYLARNPGFNNQFTSTGEIPDGVLGLRWHPVDEATSVASGTPTSWVSDDFIAFSPDPADTGWFEMYECGLPAPVGTTSEAQIEQAMASPEAFASKFPIKYGVHSYTIYNADPISAKIIVADFALPVINNYTVFCRGVCH